MNRGSNNLGANEELSGIVPLLPKEKKASVLLPLLATPILGDKEGYLKARTGEFRISKTGRLDATDTCGQGGIVQAAENDLRDATQLNYDYRNPFVEQMPLAYFVILEPRVYQKQLLYLHNVWRLGKFCLHSILPYGLHQICCCCLVLLTVIQKLLILQLEVKHEYGQICISSNRTSGLYLLTV
ncbi:hypothetical protein H5410_024255 [Solanum commersonii]|uniref:Uncharacterized protein n=1 Tax=Solanum commersonii TaxID=4109 RepID=A0A9J5ZLJ1_SOLCO|nr:hypothetical protein H5410_024255 [Solanum commersonii]